MGREGRVAMRFVDRVVLLVAWVVTCGLVYLLGLYVGKGAQERRLGLEDRLIRLPVVSTPPPEGRHPKGDSEFVFYDKLMGERPGGGHEQVRSVAADAPHPPPAPSTAIGPAPASAVKRTAAVPPGTAAGSGSPPARVVAAPARSSRPEVSHAPTEMPAPASVAARGPLAPSAAPAAGSGWTVLANPTRSREEADGIARQLRAHGYEASLVRVVRDGDTWYRVQVGRFTTSAQAADVMHRLREHEGLSHVFVASE